MCPCTCECRCVGKAVLSPFEELELQVVVIHLTWMLGTEFRSLGITACALNFWTISPAPEYFKGTYPVLNTHTHSFLGMYSQIRSYN